MVASPGRDGGELPGHQFKAGQILQRAQGPRLTQLVGLTRARGRWWIRRRRISISRLSDRDGPDPRRGEVRGRSQSHPGSIDGGVEPRLTQLVGLTRARGRWWIRRRRISISRLSDRDGPDPRRGEVRGRSQSQSQSHPGSIDGGVEPRLTQLVGLTRARGRWWIRRRRISISRLSDRDGPDPRRGEVRGRSQSHPGSIDGVEVADVCSLSFRAGTLVVFIRWQRWRRRAPRRIKAIKGNKAAADQSPLLRLFYEKSHSKRTTTRQQLDCPKTLVWIAKEGARPPDSYI